MSELENIQKNNLNKISNYLTLPGVTAKGSMSESHLIFEASFTAKNQIHYNTISIKAADIHVRNIQLADTNLETLDRKDGYSTTAILPSSQQEIQVYSNINQILEETFEDSLFIHSQNKNYIDL